MNELPKAYNGCTCLCHREPGVMHFAACCSPQQETLIERVRFGMISGCTCSTKTPDIQHHDPYCTYRILREVEVKLVELDRLKEKAVRDSWRENPDRMGGQFTDEKLNRDGWS